MSYRKCVYCGEMRLNACKYPDDQYSENCKYYNVDFYKDCPYCKEHTAYNKESYEDRYEWVCEGKCGAEWRTDTRDPHHCVILWRSPDLEDADHD